MRSSNDEKRPQALSNWIRLDCGNLFRWIWSEFGNSYHPMKIRRVYEELLKQEKRAVLRLKCLSGATAFLFFAVFLMALLGIDVFQKLDKGFDFERGNCVVKGSSFTGENVSCNCGMHTCFSFYPCLRVIVTISAKPEQSEPVLLHNTFYDLIGSEVSWPVCFTGVFSLARLRRQCLISSSNF